MKTKLILILTLLILYLEVAFILSQATTKLQPVYCPSILCGMEPMKPIPPIGCRDTAWVCACEPGGSSGCENCHWELICLE